jgi:hypothetical protein
VCNDRGVSVEERIWYDAGLDPEALAFQRLYGPWKVSTPADALELLAGYDGDWWITGGWAVEAFTGVRREHEDVDVSLWRRDVERLRKFLKGRYDLWANAGGRLSPLTDERPEYPADAVQIWLRKHALAPWEFDLQPNPDRDGRWIFRRDPDRDFPLDQVTWTAPDGVRYLTPELALTFKARLDRPKDNHDLAAALPLLGPEQRAWLAETVRGLHPDHPWLARL